MTADNTVSSRSARRRLVPIDPLLPSELTPRPRRRRCLTSKCVTRSDQTGMICGVPDKEAPPHDHVVAPPRDPKIRWWSRASPWWWGLIALLVIAVIAITQMQRISSVRSVPRAKPSAARTSVTPPLSGPVYTQAMVARRNFSDTGLQGAVLERLDLRGRDFRWTDAAGAVFAGSLLNGANFSHANLRGADLRDACLRGAILTGAKLAGADFTGADVTGAVVTPGATATAIGWASIPDPQVCFGSPLPRCLRQRAPAFFSVVSYRHESEYSNLAARSILPALVSSVLRGGTGLPARRTWKYTYRPLESVCPSELPISRATAQQSEPRTALVSTQ